MTVKHDGKMVDAVAQTTKQGWVYLFDRINGKPLFPIEYRRYPAEPRAGRSSRRNAAAAHQAGAVRAPAADRGHADQPHAAKRTQWALEQFRTFRSEGQFVPLSVGQETVVFPGFDGGAEWGGSAFDPETGLLYVNANDVAWTSSLAEDARRQRRRRQLYLTHCANCHGDDLHGRASADSRRSPASKEDAARSKSSR